MDANLRNETIRWQEKLFKRSVRRQMRLKKLKQLLGMTTGQRCLEITSGDGLLSTRLRDSGGVWTTLAVDSVAQTALRYFLDEEPLLLQGIRIDAPDNSYDAVVIIDALERVRDDHAFIRECHRVLKTDGRLIITAARKRILCMGSCPLRSMLGLSWRRRGLERPGYSSQEFFDVLKDGFDVPETESYGTCCVEVPGLIGEAFANRMAHGPYNMPPETAGTEEFYHYSRIFALGSLFYPLMWIL
ncbi:MAG: class I SAM-dependent methyltransferase, partial [Kiritimatiellales bacterium]